MLKGTQLLITSLLTFALLGACNASASIPPTPTITATKVTLTPTIATSTFTPTETFTPTSTLVPTQTPWPTATPLPISPLITHTWQAGPVLVQYASEFGDVGPYDIHVPTTLYTDGTIITWRRESEHLEIMQGKLSHKEVCAFLNTIDQTGFFNLAQQNWMQNTYQAEYDGYAVGEGAISSVIDVRVWVTQTVGFYGLDTLLDVLKDEPNSVKDRYVPRAIRAVYALRDYLQAKPLKRYVPDRLLLIVNSYGQWTEGKDWPKWPLSAPLSTLISPTILYEGQLVQHAIEGTQAASLYQNYYQQLHYSGGVGFNENGIAYNVVAFPLLPMESFYGRTHYELTLPSSDIPITTTTLTCYPADGVLPIPDED